MSFDSGLQYSVRDAGIPRFSVQWRYVPADGRILNLGVRFRRDESGQFKDIQTYKRAHAADLRHKSKAEKESAQGPMERTVRKAAKDAVKSVRSSMRGAVAAVERAAKRAVKQVAGPQPTRKATGQGATGKTAGKPAAKKTARTAATKKTPPKPMARKTVKKAAKKTAKTK